MRSRHGLEYRPTAPAMFGIFLALVWAFIGSPARAAVQPMAATISPLGQLSQGTPPVACDHRQDSPDKGWIQIFYVYRQGANHLDQKRDTIKRFVWDEDQLFEASARRFGHGDSRRLRFVQDADCQIVVTPIGVPGLPAQVGFGQVGPAADKMVDQQVAKGESGWSSRHKKVYIMDIDGLGGCGVGGGAGLGVLGGGFVSLAPGCWGAAGLEHEMGHSFGLSHCNEDHTQGNDPMCRGYDSTPRCDDVMAAVFLDCPKDEFAYFDPRPAHGSVLAQKPNQNIANSPYLIKDQPAPPMAVQLVDVANGKCLTSGGMGKPIVEKPCGTGDEWRRTIGDDGYFRLELTGTGQCMSSTTADTRLLITQACAAGGQQAWYMDDAPDGAAGDFYGLTNKSTKEREGTKERIDKGGSWQYSMHFLSAPAAAPTSGTTSQASAPSRTVATSGGDSAAGETTTQTGTDQSGANGTTGTSPTFTARTDTHLAKTGVDATTAISIGATGAALVALGGAVVLRSRRHRAVSSNRGH